MISAFRNQLISLIFFVCLATNSNSDAIFVFAVVDLHNRILISSQNSNLENRPPVLRGRNFKPRAGGLCSAKLAGNWYVTSGLAPTANMSEARLWEQVSYLAPALVPTLASSSTVDPIEDVVDIFRQSKILQSLREAIEA